MVRLLVVAPSASFRNSLRFALEAEGYDVTMAASTSDVDQPASSFACTVVDHHAVEGEQGRRFIEQFNPVVLLANSQAHPMASLSFRTLTKPSLGPSLSEAVRAATAAQASTQ